MFGIEDFTQKIVDFANFDISQLGDALIFGGAILLIGMLAIFAVLTLLWLCLIVFKILMHSTAKGKDKAVELSSTPETVIAPVVKASAESEIVAVIAAAIAMAESESDGIKFRVVSFKRK